MCVGGWCGCDVFCDRKLMHVFNRISFFIVYIDRTQTCTVYCTANVLYVSADLYIVHCVCYLIMISLSLSLPPL